MPNNNRGRRGAGRQDRGMVIVTSRPVPAQSAEAVVVIAEAFVDAHNDTSNLNNTISQQKAELKKVRAVIKKQKKAIKGLEKVSAERPSPDAELMEVMETMNEELSIYKKDGKALSKVMNECIDRGYVHCEEDNGKVLWESLKAKIILRPDGSQIKKPLAHMPLLLKEWEDERATLKQKIIAGEQAQKLVTRQRASLDARDKLIKNLEDLNEVLEELVNREKKSNKKLKGLCESLLEQIKEHEDMDSTEMDLSYDFLVAMEEEGVPPTRAMMSVVAYDCEKSCACVS
jgi:septal ring factor EnvC (AmiA/AmiB activator)